MNNQVASSLNDKVSSSGKRGIFLVGMMGSGKSYWSKQLAATLHLQAFDLDEEIERHEKKFIAQIFAEKGEIYFRKTEAEMLRRFAEKEYFVLATGGGAPCFHHNMQWMNEQGLTIWLNEPVNVLFERLSVEKNHRPLIQNVSDGELKQFLTTKLAERKPFYEQATFHCQSENMLNSIQRLFRYTKK
jgi:shikimate kinase